MFGVLTNIGKKLVGDGAELYLPFALSKLRWMATTWTGAAQSRTIRAADATILLELNSQNSGQITIWGGSASYEFFSTGASFDTGFDPAFPDFGATRGYAVTASVNKSQLTVSGKSTGNTEEAVNGIVPSPFSMTTLMRHKNLWQIQGRQEQVHYANNLPFPYLISAWGANADLVGLGALGGYPEALSQPFDQEYDEAPTPILNAATLSPTELVPDADWYRRAALCVVKNAEFGDRTFIIMVDITNKFYAYPISAIPDGTLTDGSPYAPQAIKTNVPDKYVQSMAAPFPGWVRQGTGQARDYFLEGTFTGSAYKIKFPQYMWAFNSKATKAAAIVHRLLDKPTYLNAPLAGTNLSATRAGITYDLQEALPGLVEVGFDLAVTGTDPEDFTFNVTLLQGTDPTTLEEYLLAVEYAYPVKDATLLDDMVVMNMEVYYDAVGQGLIDPDAPTGGVIDPAGVTGGYWRLQVINVMNRTTDTQIRQLCSTLQPNQNGSGFYESNYSSQHGTRIIAYDLRILAFVLQRDVLHTLHAPLRQTKAMMLEVIAFNKTNDEDKTYMSGDSALDAILDAAHADVSVEGLYKLSPNKTGKVGDGRYYQGVIEGSDLYFTALVSPPSGGNDATISTGAIEYLESADDALVGGVFDTFVVHPEGHWAVSTSPSFYYGGEISSPVELTGADGAVYALPQDIFNPALMKQDFVDVINFNIQQSDGSFKPARSTHLSVFNQATGKNALKQDLMYTFSFDQDQIYAADTILFWKLAYIKITSPYAGVQGGYYNFAGLSNFSTGTDFYRYEYYTPIDGLDSRSGGPTFSTEKLQLVSPPTGFGPVALAVDFFRQNAPVLHGSGLFSCKLNKDSP